MIQLVLKDSHQGYPTW